MMLMGTDAPALGASLLREAASALALHDAVLVPAADGGYALLGLKQPLASVFEDMPWSTSTVCELTLQRLSAAGLRVALCSTVHDIDVEDDLCHVPPGWIDSRP